MEKILVIHGPNLNLLGKRETKVYGNTTLDKINEKLREIAKKSGIELLTFQSNSEGAIVDFIQENGFTASGLIINPAAYTHTSVAIRDAILAVKILTYEVHLSNVYSREEFRHHSYIRDIAKGILVGFGPNGYYMALGEMIRKLKKNNE